MKLNKILIINLAGIGDMLLCLPALKALGKAYPDAQLSLLTTEKVYDLVKDLEYIDNIYTLKMHYGGKLAGVFGYIRTLFALRRKRFDIAVNMRTLVTDASALKMKFLLKIINPAKTAGRNTDLRGDFFNIKIPETQKGEKFEMEYDIDTVKALGIEDIDRKIDFCLDAQSEDKIRAMLNDKGIADNDIVIGIHPGGMPSRRWPLDNFIQLMEMINKSLNCYFVITGGAEEISICDELITKMPDKAVSFAGILNIKQTSALISRCNLFVSNDTGPMHIAAVLKTPLIALFGPGDITRFDPRNISDKAAVFYEHVECAPCEKVECDDMKCLKRITPKVVMSIALKLLTRRSGL